MAHIGEIGKRITVSATYKKCFEYTDYKFSYYGTTHYTHIFEDCGGNVIVWKSTNLPEWIDGDEFKFIPEGSLVELTGTVKDHGNYKDTEQTVVARCKFKLIGLAKTEREIDREQAEAQIASIGENDFVWEMPYRQYKEHYSDCETIAGSFDRHEDSSGISQRAPTIEVIIRDGRLKNSGTRGKRFRAYSFTNESGEIIIPPYRAVSEENARKQLARDFPNQNTAAFDLYTVY